MGKKVNATNIGSMPHKDPQKAVDLILKYMPKIPAWPQLPKKTFKENMYAQYSEAFPGIIVDEVKEIIYIDTSKSFSELEKFYENYLAGNTDYFKISPAYASGLHKLAESLGKNPAGVVYVKGQCVGPLTFALTVKDSSGKAAFYDPQLRDVTVKHIIMKSAWQIKLLAESTGRDAISFLDEPYLSAYGSAFTALSREEAESTLKETIDGIKAAVAPKKVLLGIHCCGNTDWPLLLDSNIDILSFDAYEFFDSLLLYSDKVKNFISRGGRLAFGIVPTSAEALAKENTAALLKRLSVSLNKLADKGVKINGIKDSSFITPACGLASRTEEFAETALRLASEMSSAYGSAI